MINLNFFFIIASPPLPPPPPTVDNVHGEHSSMNKQQQIYGLTSARQNVPDWVPANYIEKGMFRRWSHLNKLKKLVCRIMLA